MDSIEDKQTTLDRLFETDPGEREQLRQLKLPPLPLSHVSLGPHVGQISPNQEENDRLLERPARREFHTQAAFLAKTASVLPRRSQPSCVLRVPYRLS
jgi:hypothetical protein